MVGAYVTPEMWDAIVIWLDKHRPATKTSFVLDAFLEKLGREGYKLDRATALADYRSHHYQAGGVRTSALAFNERANSSSPSAEEAQLQGAAEEIYGDLERQSRQRSSGAAEPSSNKSGPSRGASRETKGKRLPQA